MSINHIDRRLLKGLSGRFLYPDCETDEVAGGQALESHFFSVPETFFTLYVNFIRV